MLFLMILLFVQLLLLHLLFPFVVAAVTALCSHVDVAALIAAIALTVYACSLTVIDIAVA